MADRPDEPARAASGRPGAVAGRVGRLVAMGCAVMVGMGTALASVGYLLLTSGHWTNDDGRFEYFFGGWQFTGAKIVLACLAVAIVAGAVVVVVRCLRATRGSTHRVSAILAGALLGIFLAPVPSVAADEALTWASEHSSEAKAAEAEYAQWQERYRLAPPKIHSNYPMPPAALAQQMLAASDLGKGWYDARTPNPASVPVAHHEAARGVTHRVDALISREHKDDDVGWSLDHLVHEAMRSFSTSAQAQRYSLTLLQPTPACRCTRGRLSVARVDGLVVSTWIVSSSVDADRMAMFRRGGTLWSINVSTLPWEPALSPTGFDRIVRLAVRRATGSG